MSSTSIVQPASRRPAALRYRGNSSQAGHSALSVPGAAQRRAQLEARWRDRLERVTELSLAYHDETASAAPGRPASTGAGSRRARQLARQAVAERQALAEIEAALDRIAAGQYGWCEQCGRPISAAILTAQPQARYCAACGRVPAQRRSPARHHSQPGHRVACA